MLSNGNGEYNTHQRWPSPCRKCLSTSDFILSIKTQAILFWFFPPYIGTTLHCKTFHHQLVWWSKILKRSLWTSPGLVNNCSILLNKPPNFKWSQLAENTVHEWVKAHFQQCKGTIVGAFSEYRSTIAKYRQHVWPWAVRPRGTGDSGDSGDTSAHSIVACLVCA